MLALWGLAGFALAPAVSLCVIARADAGAAIALGVSAFNAGIAAGSLLGGAVISQYGAGSTVLVGLIVATVALPTAWASRCLKTPEDHTETDPGAEPPTA